MSRKQDRQRIDEMAMALESQLSSVYPNGPCSSTDTTEARRQQEETIKNSLFRITEKSQYSEDHNEIKEAFQKAVIRWKDKKRNDTGKSDEAHQASQEADTTKKLSSFSLFDQLQGSFVPPVTLEEIQEAAWSQERLIVFQKIAYLEDLQMDWNLICPLLKKDLLVSSTEHALEFIVLHRKWFDQGRLFSENSPLLYGLCQNLLETIIGKVVAGSSAASSMDLNENSDACNDLLVCLVQNWRDMWLDLMLRDQYSEILAKEIETCMVLLFLEDVPSARNCQEILSMIDPCARWFQSWADHVKTNQRFVHLLSADTKVLSETWKRLKGFSDIVEQGPSWAVALHSLSILSITISRTRLLTFPWNDLLTWPTRQMSVNTLRNWKEHMEEPWSAEICQVSVTESPEIGSLVNEMLDIFLQGVQKLLADNSACAEMKLVIMNGVEAILSGCRAEDMDFDRRYLKVTTNFAESS